MIVDSLENFGLNQKEAKIYLTILKLGVAKVSDVAKKAGIIRETVYGVINSLVQKGLVSSIIKSGVRYFEAAEPTKLKVILKEKLGAIEKILPELEEIKQKRGPKPKVELFEGKEGLKTMMEDILTSKTEILTIASNKSLREMFEFYFPNFVKRRVELKIPTRLLTDGKVMTKKMIKYRFLPKSYKFKTATWVYNDKVAIVSLSQKEPIGVLIEDYEISNSQKNQFELIWSLL